MQKIPISFKALWFAIISINLETYAGLKKKLNTSESYLMARFDKNYSFKARPIQPPQTIMSVDVEYKLSFLINIDQKEENLVAFGWLTMRWNNSKLAWNESDHNISYIVVKTENIWFPHFAVKNSAETIFGDLFDHEKYRVQIFSGGNILYSTAGKTTTFCKLDLTFFPFDSQACAIEIFSWTYSDSQLNLGIYGDGIDLKNFKDNGQWKLTDSKVEVTHVHANNETYSVAKVMLIVKRKPLYFVLTLVVPCAILSFLVTFVHLLPADSTEKISLSITTLLAYSIFQLRVTEITPKSSAYVPLLTIYITFVLFFASASLLSTIFVLILHFRVQLTKPPRWLKNLAFSYLSVFLGIRTKSGKTVNFEQMWKKGNGKTNEPQTKNVAEKLSKSTRIDPKIKIDVNEIFKAYNGPEINNAVDSIEDISESTENTNFEDFQSLDIDNTNEKDNRNKYLNPSNYSSSDSPPTTNNSRLNEVRRNSHIFQEQPTNKNIATARWKQTFNVLLEPIAKIRSNQLPSFKESEGSGKFNFYSSESTFKSYKNEYDCTSSVESRSSYWKTSRVSYLRGAFKLTKNSTNNTNSSSKTELTTTITSVDEPDLEHRYDDPSKISKPYNNNNNGDKKLRCIKSKSLDFSGKERKFSTTKRFDSLEERYEEEAIKEEWTVIVLTIDRLFFIIYTCVNLLAYLLFFGIAPLYSPTDVKLPDIP